MEEQCPATFPRHELSSRPGGYKVKDANGQVLAYVYARETRADADTAKVLTIDEARRVASNIAKLPGALLGATKKSELDFPEGGG